MKSVSILLLISLALVTPVRGAKTHDVVLVFDGMQVNLKVSTEKTENNKTQFVEAIQRDDLTLLVFSTPQFSETPQSQVPVSLLNNFQGRSTF